MAVGVSRGIFNGVVSIASLLFAAPILIIAISSLFSESSAFGYVVDHLLWRYLSNALLLWLGVVVCSSAIGVLCAWVVTIYEFPFRKWLQWLLFLPLAMPSYIAAIVYGYQLDVAGPLQKTLRDFFNWGINDYWFPDIYSLAGAIFVLSITLYPYIYMLSLIAFRKQCGSFFESAYLLGVSQRYWLYKIALPIARPVVMVGVALVSMETFADFGVVSLYGIESFTTGIYRSWFGLGDVNAAIKLSGILLLIISGFVMLERFRPVRFRQEDLPAAEYSILRRRPKYCIAILLMVGCTIPCLLGFLLPVLQLVNWVLADMSALEDVMHWEALQTTLYYAMLTVGLVIVVATLFAYGIRYPISQVSTSIIRLASYGYAIPGAVLAVAIFSGLWFLDRMIAFTSLWLTGGETSQILVGSVIGVVLACSVRFLAIGLGAVESDLRLISTRMDESAMLLGSRRWQIFHHVHLPHLKTAYLLCGFAVFADTAKELPATLMLRPFDMTTLAIRTYELAQDGRVVSAAMPALMLVSLSSIAVALFIYYDQRSVKAKAKLKSMSA
ncbi:MAG: iron ABC transporter permease [Rickettsiales bacterium]|nr:iron ABC transporter permease [Rickettsiales bacterium]